MTTVKDTIVVCLSDMHSGGTTALFPAKFWQFKHQNHTPTEEQLKMYDHFSATAQVVAKARKGKRLIIVHDGDAIDGIHHKTPQSITQLKREQMDIHIDLMDDFMQAVNFGKEDLLYYVTGTEVHVNDSEDRIGEDLGAEKNGDLYAFDLLDLEVNGLRLWFSHHGTSSGKGANKGNALRNFMRNVYYDCQGENIRPPDFVITGHTHDPMYEILPRWEGNKFHMLHGAILPSWQQKTRYAYRVAPTQLNRIGLAWFEIKASGDILLKRGGPFELMEDDRKPVRA